MPAGSKKNLSLLKVSSSDSASGIFKQKEKKRKPSQLHPGERNERRTALQTPRSV